MFRIKIRYIIIAVILIVLAYLFGGTLPYSFLYSLVFVLIISMVHVGILWNTMDLQIKLEKTSINIDEELHIYMVMDTIKFLPAPYIIVKNNALEKLKNNYNGDIVPLNFSKEKIIPNDIKFKIRGVYNFGETKVKFTDLFCVIMCEKKYLSSQTLRVYPKVYNLNQRKINGKNILQDTLANISVAEDSNDIRDLRKYRVGDSLKKIHWKLSAKHSELYVKNFSAVSSKDACIFLNMEEASFLQQDQELLEEKTIDFTVSLINFLQRNGYRIKIYINNLKEKYFYIGTNEDFRLIMEYFVEHKSEGNKNFSNFVSIKTKLIESCAWVAVVSQNFHKEILEQTDELSSRGFMVAGFYTGIPLKENDFNSEKCQYFRIEDILLNEN